MLSVRSGADPGRQASALWDATFIVDGEFSPGEIEDEQRVDERRAQIGLPPLAEYIAVMTQAYGQQ